MTAAVMPVRAVTCLGLLAAALACTGLPLHSAEPSPACADCHDQVDHKKFAASVHGFLTCTDCHTGANQFPHAEGVRQVNCAACHADVLQQYDSSIHGRAHTRGAAEAPTCTSCHGDIHTLISRADPASPIHPTRLATTCGSCHANPELVAKFHIPVARPLEAYRDSVHARAIAIGGDGATCNDCHGSHGILPSSDPNSTIFRANVPRTCGSCHKDIAAAFQASVHGIAVARGNRDAPVCTDCHGEHRILSPRDLGSPVFPTIIPLQTCGRCHSDLRLSEKYGLPRDKVPSYEDSYHGLAGRAGVQSVANCASCHGVHDILPSSDARSHVNPANLAQTCGQCHPGAGTRFALGPVHIVETEARFTAVYYIRLLYLPLIWFTIGGMLLHNLLDFIRKARRRAPQGFESVPMEEERMTRGFRFAHALVMVSFSILVYTGFALKYPESWWAQPVIHWESGLGLRGWLHRIAGVILLAATAGHLIHLATDRRARACIAAMRPGLGDWREFLARMRYYFGLSEHPPHGIRVGYIEKAEYWAFLWGTMVMGVTGLLLWFENFTLEFFPKWVADASTAIHFYEAILASLAILVWHFYWVIFDPDVYPMDTTWWSGRSPGARVLERLPRPEAMAAAD
ncbi:MAG TPA: cytochrome c3 family protein, partial [Candidatus Acidoferrales bacterium]|nr:cytochrome c3 family protein [Candidatus Acidoferrales bacterium]